MVGTRWKAEPLSKEVVGAIQADEEESNDEGLEDEWVPAVDLSHLEPTQ